MNFSEIGRHTHTMQLPNPIDNPTKRALGTTSEHCDGSKRGKWVS